MYVLVNCCSIVTYRPKLNCKGIEVEWLIKTLAHIWTFCERISALVKWQICNYSTIFKKWIFLRHSHLKIKLADSLPVVPFFLRFAYILAKHHIWEFIYVGKPSIIWKLDLTRHFNCLICLKKIKGEILTSRFFLH